MPDSQKDPPLREVNAAQRSLNRAEIIRTWCSQTQIKMALFERQIHWKKVKNLDYQCSGNIDKKFRNF